MRATIVLVSVTLLTTGGCAPQSGDRQTLRRVALPDLSRVEESVQVQLRERDAALTAKQNDPGTPIADLATEYGEMGKLLMAADFRDPAEASLLSAQALAPGDMRWPYYLAHLYMTNGDMPKATAALERALQAAPNDVPTMIWLGESALDRGRPDAAEPLFTKALSLQPRSVAARYGLGRTALAKQDYARAAENLEQALALDDKASRIHYPLALAYRGLGDPRRAEWHLQQRGTLQVKPDDPLIKDLDELLNSALTYEIRGEAASNNGDWAAAAAYHRKAVALAPKRASMRRKLGTALFFTGDRRGALEQFQEAVRLEPAFALAHYNLGVIHEEMGQHQQAIESFAAAVRSEPDYLEARFGQAVALIRLARYQEARNRLVEAMDRYPHEMAFARAAARLLAAAPDDRVRDGRRAMAIARMLVSRLPRTIEVAETMAMASAEMGQYDDAVMWQQQAIDAAGRQPHLVGRLGDNLKLYQAHRPCRTPWRADEPLEFVSR